MDSGIPLSRGLGSSAAAVVAVGVLQLVPSSFVPFRSRETYFEYLLHQQIQPRKSDPDLEKFIRA